MATYGPNNGFVPFTGFSPTLGTGDAATPASAGSAQMNGMGQVDYTFSRMLQQPGNRVMRRLLQTMIGNAVGNTATEPYTRVKGQVALTDPTALGGLVPIETVNTINRATTTADRTNMVNALTRGTGPTSYVADASGNAGGGKLGY